MRLIVKESQYKSIIKEQQSTTQTIKEWSRYIMDKMLLNVSLTDEEIISETQLNRKIYKNNFYKKLPINNITINTIKGKDKNCEFEMELKDDIVENLFLDIQIPHNGEIKVEDIKNVLGKVTNKRFNLLQEQTYKLSTGVDVEDFTGILTLIGAWFRRLTGELPTIISFERDKDEVTIGFDVTNIEDAKWNKLKSKVIKHFSKTNHPYGGYVKSVTDDTMIFDDATQAEIAANVASGGGDSISTLVDINNEDLIILDPNSSPFGMRDPIKSLCDQGYSRYCKRHMHAGQDYAYTKGTKIILFKPGIVTEKGCECLKIKHDDGTSSRYCHLDKQKVGKGDKIEGGTFIGTVGGKGYSKKKKCHDKYGVHLHLEYEENGKKVNPIDFAKKYLRFLDKNIDYKKIKNDE